MARLRKSTLLDRFLNAVSFCGWGCFVESVTHPFLVRIWAGEEFRTVRLYIWNLTSGGPERVRPAGEFRVQITGVQRPLPVTLGVQDLLLGWEEELAVFAAFDVEKHRTYGSSPSIQISLNTLRTAQNVGIAFQERGNAETVVSFIPGQITNYLSRQRELHTLAQVPEEAQILANAAEENPRDAEEFDLIPTERQDAITSVHRWLRDRSFRDRVLRAYQHSCSVCNVQLQMVQAAHIVPVHIPGSNDSTSNGLALCPSHHVAYDAGLLGVTSDYYVVVNNGKLDRLRSLNLNEGEQSILEKVGAPILVPDQLCERPSPELLKLGMEIRGWPTTQIFYS